MTTIYAIHGADPERLQGIISEMRELGAPTIKAVDCGDHLQALEGSHRLAAAAALGIVPNFEITSQDEEIDISGYDWYESANWAETIYAAGEVAAELFAPTQAQAYTF